MSGKLKKSNSMADMSNIVYNNLNDNDGQKQYNFTRLRSKRP